jgi:glycosyltransferase involved in cell wall biosynthesis
VPPVLEPKSLLMTTDAVGGVWRYSLELARALGARGVRVSLVVLGPEPSAEQRQSAARLENVRLFECPGALEWMDDPWEDVARAGTFLQGLARALEPDIVHLNGYCHGHLDFGSPKVVVGHSCVLSWWQAVERSALPSRLEPYRSAVRRGLSGADLVVAPSEHMLRCLREHYGPLPRARVILNGRTPSALLGEPKYPFVLCAARLWDRAKNVATLARAAAGLSWPVFVAGPGSGDLPHVRALGHVEPAELWTWYERASIYAHPARYEPFGLSVLEAALAGAALVLGDVPSLRELWGEAAVYVSPDDSDALRSELERLIFDHDRRTLLGRSAKARAERLSADVMASRYSEAYSRLMATRTSAPSANVA